MSSEGLNLRTYYCAHYLHRIQEILLKKLPQKICGNRETIRSSYKTKLNDKCSLIISIAILNVVE